MGMVESSNIIEPLPIPSRRCLPTLDRPLIVLQGDQRLYRAKARIDNMAMAPVLHDAIGVFNRLPIFLHNAIRALNRSSFFLNDAIQAPIPSLIFLAIGAQAQQANRAKGVGC
jgi:hypothetical protein